MNDKNQKQANILTFRLTEVRKKKIQLLRSLDLFKNTKKLSQIFDFLIDTTIDHPERFENSLITSEADILSFVKEIRESQLQFNRQLINVLETLYDKVNSIEKRFDLLLRNKRIAELSFSDEITKREKK